MSEAHHTGGLLRRVLVEGLGWLLILFGLAAIVLPGPGLLALVGGLAILGQQYEWARKRLDPVKRRAFQAAREGVQTWPRIALSCLAAFVLMAIGVVWGLRPGVPSWWAFPDRFWLPGGWGTGSSLIGSGIIALIFVIYSIFRFRDEPAEAVEPGYRAGEHADRSR